MDKVMRNEDHVQEIVSKSGQNFLYQAHANSHLHESLSIWRLVNSGRLQKVSCVLSLRDTEEQMGIY